MSESAGVRWFAVLLATVLLGACDRPDTDTGDPEPECGNGLVEEGEQCDDADTDDADLCLATCVLAACGDGLVFADFEECDNGAANADTAACRADCTLQTCGDGDTGPGEECDDGNDVDTDACRDDCTLAGCGDGSKTPSEECDDNNDVGGDGCTTACLVEPGWVCDGACACAPGYTGTTCGTCDTGYQDVDGNGSCLPDCGLFSALDGCDLSVSYCAIEDGAATCACNDGLFDQGSGCALPPTCRVHVAPGATGNGSGSSWADAKTSLQAAIDTAAGLAEGTLDGRCEVWAAEGQYVVFGTQPTDTLLLRSGVVVRGGFAGAETALDHRPTDPVTGFLDLESVLDGRDGSTHVVTGASDATLDGFVITGGRAIGTRGTSAGYGGGLYAKDTLDLVVSLTTFRANHALDGGALHLDGGSLTLSDVRFLENTADWDGGAVHAVDYLALDLQDVWFGSNTAEAWSGGGLYSFGSGTLIVTGSTFVDNSAKREGGALWHAGSTAVVLIDSRFADNANEEWPHTGGGVFLRGIDQSDVTAGRATAVASLAVVQVAFTRFAGNLSPSDGGALYLRDVLYADVIGGDFSGNTGYRGAAVFGESVGEVSFDDTTFVCNLAHLAGGGLYLSEAASLAVTDVVFDGNETAEGFGGGIYAEDVAGAVSLHETVFTGNLSDVDGGGMFLDGFASLSVDGGAFLDNRVNDNQGGGLLVHGDFATSTVAIDGTLFSGNFTDNIGSALVATHLLSIDVRRAVFRDNGNDDTFVTGAMGGMFLRFTRHVTIDATVFEDNAVQRIWGAGALWIMGFEDVWIRGSRFVGSPQTYNLTTLRLTTGAVYLCGAPCDGPNWWGDGADPTIDFESTVTILDSEFDDNGSQWKGAHLTAEYLASLHVEDSTFTAGTTRRGAAVWVEGVDATTVLDTNFEGNVEQNADPNEGTASALDVRGEGAEPASGWSLLVEGSAFLGSVGAPPLRTLDIHHVTVRDTVFEGLGQSVLGAAGGTASCADSPDFWKQGENFGGAAHLSGWLTALVEDCSFEDFEAAGAGALGIDSGRPGGTVTVRRTSFARNQARQAGGSLAIHGSTGSVMSLLLADLDFDDTRTLCNSGGALQVEYFDTVTLSDSTFEDYGTELDAGAAQFVYNDRVTITDTSFVESKGDDVVAGALLIERGKTDTATYIADEVVLDGVRIESSSTGSTGGGAQIGWVDAVHVVDSVIEGNACDAAVKVRMEPNPSPPDFIEVPTWCLGAGLYVHHAGDVLVERTGFLANEAVSDLLDEGAVGGGLTVEWVHTLIVRASVFFDNVVDSDVPNLTADRGAAIEFRPAKWQSRADPLALTVEGSTFVDNASTAASAISVSRLHAGDVESIAVDVVNTIVRDPTGANVIEQWRDDDPTKLHTGEMSIRFGDIARRASAPDDVVDVDPQFLAPSAADPWQQFTLAPASPLVGQGTPLATDTVDLRGNPRANPPSIGAFEPL